MTQYTTIKTLVEDLSVQINAVMPGADSSGLAYLSMAVEKIAGPASLLDIVAVSDEKQSELKDAATTHLAAIDGTNAAILKNMNERESDAVAAIVLQQTESTLAFLEAYKTNVDTFQAAWQERMETYDARTENMLQITDASLPFIFGVLSRSGDHYGAGVMTTQLGQWHRGHGNDILGLLTGSNAYDRQYIGFTQSPGLQFLQGSNGSFMYQKFHTRHDASSNMYNYPNALLSCIFVKNTTDTDITRIFSFGGSCQNSSYAGAALHLGVPDARNTQREDITKLEWSVVYAHTAGTTNFSRAQEVTLPAGKTAVLLVYNSEDQTRSHESYDSFFQHQYIYDVRKDFLTEGLEIDAERTLKAWRGGDGVDEPYKLWH